MPNFIMLVLCFYSFLTDLVSANMAEVEKATSQFYKALNTIFVGNAQPMKEIWSHSSDVTYMGPDGMFQKGWDRVEKEWERQAADKLGGEVHPTQTHTLIGSNIAVVYCIESGVNIVNKKKEPVEIRASTIFRKEAGAWKVVGHQTDTLHFLKSK